MKQRYKLKPRWVKGQSGNPKGRPKKIDCFMDIAREMLESKEIDIKLTLPDGSVKSIGIKSSQSFNHGVAASMIRKAMSGDVSAAREIIDRAHGKVSDKLELSGGQKLELVEEIVDANKN